MSRLNHLLIRSRSVAWKPDTVWRGSLLRILRCWNQVSVCWDGLGRICVWAHSGCWQNGFSQFVFLRAAVTNDHTLTGLKQQICSFTVQEARRTTSRLSGAGPHGDWGGTHAFLRAPDGGPRSLLHGTVARFCASVFRWPSLLRVCLNSASVIPWNQDDLTSRSRTIFSKTVFSSKVTFTGPGV